MRIAALLLLSMIGCGSALAPAHESVVATAASGGSNLWPNADSETEPPPGTTVPNDGSNGQWDYRANIGGGAHEGTWVRQMAALPAGVYPSPEKLRFRVGCTPGQTFALSAWVKAGPASGAAIELQFLDASGGLLDTHGYAVGLTGSWQSFGPASGQAPPHAAWVEAQLVGPVSGTNMYDDIVFTSL